MKKTLRDYQKRLAEEGSRILSAGGILYCAAQMRVGKTAIALQAAKLAGARSVLFLTKKMAVGSVERDYSDFGFSDNFKIQVLSHESAHKADSGFDLVVVDEAHTLGAFPRPSVKTRKIKELCGRLPLILLSGTPTPESYSQIYHQLWVSSRTPFQEQTFYKWAAAGYVTPHQMRISGYTITDYSDARKDLIDRKTKKLFLTFTQRQAEFEVSELEDEIVWIDPSPKIYQLVDKLVKDRVYRFKDGRSEIVCDTAAKLQSKIHQICSGTVIVDDVETRESRGQILDMSKARYIKEHYRGKKIAVFYLFIAEGAALRMMFSDVAKTPEEFKKRKSSVFVSQFQSGSRGIDLSCADVIIFYNIHFSSELYQQARQRGQEKSKTTATKIHWLFTKRGIEQRVYDAVQEKQDYTLSYFARDYMKGARP